MGYPIDASYSTSSNVDNAYRLKGKLLLINGELDDNVDPASTLQVVSALMKANKNFEQLYLPGKTHSLGGPFECTKCTISSSRICWGRTRRSGSNLTLSISSSQISKQT